MLSRTSLRFSLIQNGMLALGILISSDVAHANSLLQNMNFQNWYVGANVGTSMPTLSNNSSVVVPAVSDVVPQGTAHTTSVSGAMAFSVDFGAQFGIAHAAPTAWFNYYRLGLRYQNQLAEKLSGHGSLGNSPTTDDVYNYTYQAQTQFILLDSALGLYDWRKVTSYLHLGFGMANTSATNYSETPTSQFPYKDSYAFSNGSSSAMVGVVGLGLDYVIHKNWHAVLSYDYFMPVKAKLGTGTFQGTSLTGPQASVGNQTISLGVRYQF
jgi:hypothetical protein